MTDTAEMHFSIQGSAALPYKIKAYGSGVALQMFCDCPAGRQARYFCKHIASLLMGDITTLVHPSDCVEQLKQRALGSSLVAMAFGHQPSVKRTVTTEVPLDAGASAGLDVALASIAKQAEALGWIVFARPCSVGLFGRTKTGRMLKHPSVEIAYVEEQSTRPYSVRSTKESGKTYAHIERAAGSFWEMANRYAPNAES